MPTSPKVDINVINQTTRPSEPLSGIHFVMGPTLRGKFNNPEDIITSWAQFKRIYGGLMTTSDFPLLCRRALEGGALLRVNRIGHYTDISDINSVVGTVCSSTSWSYVRVSGNLVTGNEVNIVGAPGSDPVPTIIYAVSHNATMGAIVTAIKTLDQVDDAILLDKGSGNNTLIWVKFKPSYNGVTKHLGITATGGATQPTFTVVNTTKFLNAFDEELFSITPNAKGSGYNGIRVQYNHVTANRYSLKVYDPNDSAVVIEEFEVKMSVTVSGTLDDEGTFALVNANSKIITITNLATEANDLTLGSSIVSGSNFEGVNNEFAFGSGTDGDPIENVDYIGDSSAKTGIHAFDNYDDGWLISAPHLSENSVHVKGSSYSIARKDLVYVAHLALTNKTTTTLVNAKDAITGLNNHVITSSGGIKISNPTTGMVDEISEVGDLLALSSQVQSSYGAWYPFTGPNRGIIRNALGVVNNFGSMGLYNDLNVLANNQILMTIARNNQIMAWGGYTQDQTGSQLQWLSTTMLIIYLRKVMRPTLESFIDEPATIQTLKRIYEIHRPTLEGLQNRSAFTSYEWNGDQNAKTDSDLQINTPTGLQQGKVRIQLLIKPVGFIQEIAVDIVITDAGVSFELASALAA